MKYYCGILWYSDPAVPTRSFYKGDYVFMNDCLTSIEWEFFFNCHDVDSNWEYLTEKIHTAMSHFIPLKLLRSQNTKPPWWSKSLSKAVRQKCILFNIYKQTNDYQRYASGYKICIKEVRGVTYF